MQMKDRNVLLTAINAKYIHSNLAVYSLKANAGPYAGRVGIAEYTINHRREEILQGIYDHSPAVVGFSCYIWNIEQIKALGSRSAEHFAGYGHCTRRTGGFL